MLLEDSTKRRRLRAVTPVIEAKQDLIVKQRGNRDLTIIYGYVASFLWVVAATALLLLLKAHLDKAHIGLMYLLVVASLAATRGTRPAVFAAILSFLAWNYFFLHPRFTLVLSDPEDWILLFTFLVIGVLVGHITGQMRAREAEAVAREKETTALYLERQRLMEEAVRLKGAEETERLKSVFFSSLSHNLKTPLASLVATISSLRQNGVSSDPEVVKECLESLKEDSDRLSEYIENLLSFAQLESGSWQPRGEWVELGEIVSVAARRFPERDYRRLHVEIPEDFPMIQVDSVQLAQVVRHLMENALRYSPSETRVVVGAHTQDGAIELFVEDEGPGIPESEKEKIFHRGYSGPRGGEQPGGTGLGLAICREIVKGHLGAISVEDTEKGGARFRVSLPVKQEMAQ
ncbi:MAG: DUF4118 domain-containing protein [Armatimonadetes bacterium]|nr:DUF4118 domain-containing protein [Armatimonadota bacterium]